MAVKKQLPAHPSLEHYRKAAKDLVRSLKSGDPEAAQRIREQQPPSRHSSRSEAHALALADAQWIIAREHGFESWPQFARQIRALRGESSADRVWSEAQRALITGDADVLERLLRDHDTILRRQQPRPFTADPGSLAPDYSAATAREVILANHQFERWPQFARYREALENIPSDLARFEAAVEAVVAGDITTLERLLASHPDLTRARSTRRHHATLLHYVGANGVEAFRQRTPGNAVDVVKFLIYAGARVDEVADLYGGSTTLELVATSLHPLRAGVQDALLTALLDAGAVIRGPGAVNACLANGRPEAAALLALRGAPLDLEGAAGLGRLDLVRSYFDSGGGPRPPASRSQMENGLAWACEYGHTAVAAFLLDRGIEVSAKLRPHGQTGLHWAAAGGYAETVGLLLQRRAPVDARDDSFKATPLEWALHGWSESAEGSRRDGYLAVVALLLAAGAPVEPEWLVESERASRLSKSIRSDPRMLALVAGSANPKQSP
jgi:hypothetical protein